MNSEAKPRIPVVDLSGENLKAGSESWNSACRDIRKALEEFGCMELVYSKPTLEFHNTVLKAADELFQLPYESKSKNTNPKPGHGYVGNNNSSLPIHEGLGIEYATDEQECQNFTNLMWPHGNPFFCESVHRYAKMVAELQELLVRMICDNYGVEKEHAESHVKSTTYLLRLLRYSRSTADTSLGFRSHTDKSFLSILHQNHVKGLEIRTKNGDWIPFLPSSYSSFVVIVGDVLMAWSNDRMKSCPHRVEVEEEGVRYVLALFSFIKGWIKTPKELVDEENPLKYKPFEHQALLDFFRANYNPNEEESKMVKNFCGI